MLKMIKSVSLHLGLQFYKIHRHHGVYVYNYTLYVIVRHS